MSDRFDYYQDNYMCQQISPKTKKPKERRRGEKNKQKNTTLICGHKNKNNKIVCGRLYIYMS